MRHLDRGVPGLASLVLCLLLQPPCHLYFYVFAVEFASASSEPSLLSQRCCSVRFCILRVSFRISVVKYAFARLPLFPSCQVSSPSSVMWLRLRLLCTCSVPECSTSPVLISLMHAFCVNCYVFTSPCSMHTPFLSTRVRSCVFALRSSMLVPLPVCQF